MLKLLIIFSIFSFIHATTRIKIVNRQYGEALCTCCSTAFPVGREIFMLPPSSAKDDYCHWAISDHSEHTAIRNLKNDGYMFAAEDDYNVSRVQRRVLLRIFEAKFDKDCYWIIQKVPGDENYVTIKNLYRDEYLVASQARGKSKGRLAYTRIEADYDAESDPYAQWTLESQ